MAVVVGTGGHARDILATLNPKWSWIRIPHHDEFFELYPAGSPYPLYIGINDPWVRDKACRDIGYNDEAWVHPTAHLGVETVMGFGTHINYGVHMTRTTIGHHTTISPGVTICGDVSIGDRVLVGAGATICDRVTIGDDVTIGAGAVILPETVIPAGVTALGVPARW